MAYGNNVMQALENCIKDGTCINCPYEKHVACKHFLMASALALLKQYKECMTNCAVVNECHGSEIEACIRHKTEHEYG